MITLKSCPNCNSAKIASFRFLPGGMIQAELMKGVKVNAQIITSYCVCSECRLIFQNPRLSDKELAKYYGSGLYREIVTKPPEGMDRGEENRAEIDSKIIAGFLGKVSSHLDVGCGRGYLLKMVDADIKVGVESDKAYVKFKEIKVYKDLAQVSLKKFDLVTSIHSLEHMPHPMDYLAQMAKFVKKDGHMVIEVPSWKTRGGPLGFAHLHHFEPDVLRLMCLKVGLKPIHTEFTPHLVLVCKINDK